MSWRKTVLASVLLVATTGCGNIQLKPPPPPPATMPAGAHDLPAAPDDVSRVFITTDTPARVLLATGGVVTTHRRRPAYVGPGTLLCAATPCVVTLPEGQYDLWFEGLGDSDRSGGITVQVSRPQEVVNHRLGRDSVSVGKPLGILTMVLGAIALGTSLSITRGKASEATPLLSTMAIGGATSMVFGAGLYFASPTYRQEGSTTQWSPSQGPLGRTISTGVGLRF